eukprot:Gb_02876 [translate_table: standard]
MTFALCPTTQKLETDLLDFDEISLQLQNKESEIKESLRKLALENMMIRSEMENNEMKRACIQRLKADKTAKITLIQSTLEDLDKCGTPVKFLVIALYVLCAHPTQLPNSLNLCLKLKYIQSRGNHGEYIWVTKEVLTLNANKVVQPCHPINFTFVFHGVFEINCMTLIRACCTGKMKRIDHLRKVRAM